VVGVDGEEGGDDVAFCVLRISCFDSDRTFGEAFPSGASMITPMAPVSIRCCARSASEAREPCGVPVEEVVFAGVAFVLFLFSWLRLRLILFSLSFSFSFSSSVGWSGVI